MSRRGAWLAGAVAASPGVLLAVWLVQGWGGGYATRVADDLILTGYSAAGAACCLHAARRARSGSGHESRRLAATWRALGLGVGGWAAGDAIWAYYEVWLRMPQAPFPSPADAGYLLFPVGVGLGLLLFPGAATDASRIRSLMDGVIVAASLFVVSWVAVLGPVYRAGAENTLGLVISLAYPLTDVALLTMTLLVLSRARTTHRRTLALISAGTALVAFSDSGFAYLTVTNPYTTGNLIDLGWMVGLSLFGLAALTPTPASQPQPRAAGSPSRLWLPYIPLLLAAGVGLKGSLPALASGPLPGAWGLLVAAVLVRQLLTVAENRRLLVAVAHQAFHDPLTGLANRALFTDRLEHTVALHERDRRPLAVLCLDLDDFKLVNDSLGHLAGDALLVHVAERLIGCLRASDTIARLGGDEFAVLVEEGAQSTALIARRVSQAFETPFVVEGRWLEMRASIGAAVASADDTNVTATGLLRSADAAMYASKRDGTGIALAGAAIPDGHDVDELALRHDLAVMVASGKVEVAYQPIVSIASSEVVAVEALARWTHPVHGPVPPSRFVPMAEHAGLIGQLGREVLDTSLRDLASWGGSVRLTVNVSAHQLADPSFPALVQSLLQQHQVAPVRLILEITEGALLTRIEQATSVVAALDALGVSLALDDFGVGFSSLTHLSRLPLRILKIDRSFIDGSGSFLAALLQLGRSLGLQLIAEGVESQAQLHLLRSLGFELAQGYYLGRPAPASTIMELLRDHAAARDPAGLH